MKAFVFGALFLQTLDAQVLNDFAPIADPIAADVIAPIAEPTVANILAPVAEVASSDTLAATPAPLIFLGPDAPSEAATGLAVSAAPLVGTADVLVVPAATAETIFDPIDTFAAPETSSAGVGLDGQVPSSSKTTDANADITTRLLTTPIPVASLELPLDVLLPTLGGFEDFASATPVIDFALPSSSSSAAASAGLAASDVAVTDDFGFPIPAPTFGIPAQPTVLPFQPLIASPVRLVSSTRSYLFALPGVTLGAVVDAAVGFGAQAIGDIGVPAVGGIAVPAVGGIAAPAVGGIAVPAVGGIAAPAVGGVAAPAIGVLPIGVPGIVPGNTLGGSWSEADDDNYDGEDYGEDWTESGDDDDDDDKHASDHDDHECPSYCRKGSDDYDTPKSVVKRPHSRRSFRRRQQPASGGFAAFNWPASSGDGEDDDLPDWIYDSAGKKKPSPKPSPKPKCPKSCYDKPTPKSPQKPEYTRRPKPHPGSKDEPSYPISTDAPYYEPYPTSTDAPYYEPYRTSTDASYYEPYPTSTDASYYEPYPTSTDAPYSSPNDEPWHPSPSGEPHNSSNATTWTDEFSSWTSTTEKTSSTAWPSTTEEPWSESSTEGPSTTEEPWSESSTEGPSTTKEPWSESSTEGPSTTKEPSSGTTTWTTFVTSVKTDSPPEPEPSSSDDGKKDWTGGTLADICPKTCNPFNPVENFCDITSSCVTTGGSKYYCACRAGYRASAWDEKDFSKQFHVPGQPYVYVAPGVVCDALCKDQTCMEVLERSKCV